MVLRRDDKKIAFLSADTVAVNAEFLKDLVAYLGTEWNPNEIFMGATHSHSGPGGLTKTLMWQLIAMDRFLPEVYWRTIQQTGDAILKAHGEATEAELFATEFKADGLQKNRRDDHAPMHFDPVAHLILAKNAHGWLGGMVNFAIHGTSLGEENHLWSADVPGAIEHSFGKALAKLNGDVEGELPIVFFNGAEGDVKPVKSGLEKMLWIGEEFARQAIAAMAMGMRPVEGRWSVKTSPVSIGTAKLTIRSCIPRQSIQRLISPNVKLNVGWFNPEESNVWLIKLGDIHMATWPGEATTNLGLRLRKMAKTEGINQSIFMGLTNDYTVYYTDEEEFDYGEYEACSSLYGPIGGRRILAAHEDLLRIRTKK
jgi:hypothetical protein